MSRLESSCCDYRTVTACGELTAPSSIRQQAGGGAEDDGRVNSTARMHHACVRMELAISDPVHPALTVVRSSVFEGRNRSSPE